MPLEAVDPEYTADRSDLPVKNGTKQINKLMYRRHPGTNDKSMPWNQG